MGPDGQPASPPEPLINDERLLVNVAGSWHRRPTAQTAFENLVIAGDYVRTSTDFASMESANEAAKRAVNVILHRDDGADRCKVYNKLPVPKALGCPIAFVRMLGSRGDKIGFPHPIMLVATPIGWFAGLEDWLRLKCVPATLTNGQKTERCRRTPLVPGHPTGQSASIASAPAVETPDTSSPHITV